MTYDKIQYTLILTKMFTYREHELEEVQDVISKKPQLGQ